MQRIVEELAKLLLEAFGEEGSIIINGLACTGET